MLHSNFVIGKAVTCRHVASRLAHRICHPSNLMYESNKYTRSQNDVTSSVNDVSVFAAVTLHFSNCFGYWMKALFIVTYKYLFVRSITNDIFYEGIMFNKLLSEIDDVAMMTYKL